MAQKNRRNTPTQGRGAVMGVNKSRTPLWMKIILVLIAVAMVAGMALSFATMGSVTAPQQSAVPGAPAKSVDAAQKKYADAIADLEAKVAADPTDRASLVSLGNLYFDSAQEGQNVAANIDELMVVQGWWKKAVEVYDRANAIEVESPVAVDAAVATFYSGDATSAIEAVTTVTEDDPGFAMAWLNLGQFNDGVGKTAEALAAYERYLEADPTNQTGYRQSVQARIDELK